MLILILFWLGWEWENLGIRYNRVFGFEIEFYMVENLGIYRKMVWVRVGVCVEGLMMNVLMILMISVEGWCMMDLDKVYEFFFILNKDF